MQERIRGRRLQAIRRSHLSAYPLCVHCEAQGRTELATEVDHIVALVNGGADMDSNRQGLCKDCHADKTRADLGHKARQAIGFDGWPIGAG
jgi:5-methylcytosine-specific restriction protein A